MCGIVGYIGEQQAAPILLDGLSKLEYRGYDSAGIAVYDGEKINMVKATGRLKVLEELTQNGAVLPELRESAIPAGRLMAVRLTPTPILISIKTSLLLLSTTELSKIM